MKLRTKLLIAFFTVVVLPIVMVYALFNAMGLIQAKALKDDYNISGVGDYYSGASVQMFNTLTQTVQQEIGITAQREPDKFLDTDYLAALNEGLDGRYSYLAVYFEGGLIFNGNSAQSDEELSNEIQEYYAGSSTEGNTSVYIADSSKLIKQQTVVTSDGRDIVVYIVTDVGVLIPQFRNMFKSILFLIVLLLVFVAIFMAAWVYREILSPLAELKRATNEIKNGNLDYEMKIRDKDEIGQVFRDFEEMRQRLKDNADEKIRADRESKELISNIAHDLKTPITTIKGYSEGILDGVASSPEKMEKYIRTISSKASDMARLIDELTFYSKIDTNRIPYSFTRLCINDYFQDCVEEMSPELEERKIQLALFDYTDGPVTVIADVEQLKRVINNIIGNSVKYLDKEHGVVNIRLKDEGDFVLIEIEDNGKGIAARDLPNIFERFYRTDSSRNSTKGGSGIGLSIVKKIIEDHGGRIWATSKEGIGTTMHIELRKYQEVIHE